MPKKQRRNLPGEDADDGDGQPPEHEAGRESWREPVADQPGGDDRADDRAHADGRIEISDSGVARVQKFQRRDRRQHSERAVDEGLRRHQGDDGPQSSVAGDSAKPGADGRRKALLRVFGCGCALRLCRSILRQPHGKQGGKQEATGGDRSQGRRAAETEHDPPDRRADEDRQRLDRAVDHVGRGQLVRTLAETGQHGGDRGLQDCHEDALQAADGDHRRHWAVELDRHRDRDR